jgi:hypothetical protein
MLKVPVQPPHADSKMSDTKQQDSFCGSPNGIAARTVGGPLIGATGMVMCRTDIR